MAEKTFGIRGFPQKCICGGDVTIYTAKTQDNPGRPFFRCVTRKEDHLFKWVEEGVYEELLDALTKLRDAESDICSAKSEIEEMKAVMEELMEDALRSKQTLRRSNALMLLCVVCLCIIIIVVVVGVVILSGKTSN